MTSPGWAFFVTNVDFPPHGGPQTNVTCRRRGPGLACAGLAFESEGSVLGKVFLGVLEGVSVSPPPVGAATRGCAAGPPPG